MKLLLDHNLSHRMLPMLSVLFPDSTHAKLLGFERATDYFIWSYAREHGFVLVTFDRDFADLTFLRGAPPKVIWLRCGNATVRQVEQLFRANLTAIEEFDAANDSAVLEVFA